MNETTVEPTDEDVLIDEVSDEVLERAGMGGATRPVTETLWVILSACCC
jgi:hypothetical protein